jgi:hypothetical protein
VTNEDLEAIYKSSLPVSHFAGLRAVYDAGYDAAASIDPGTSSGDASMTQPAPSADVTVNTP